MLSLFFCPKPFNGKIKATQRNAIKSWKALRPEPEIILVGNDPGSEEACRDFGIAHIPEVERNEYGTPLVSSIFKEAQEKAPGNILCYVNADIILTQDFVEAVELARKWSDKFLMVGRRTDVDIAEEVDFNDSGWARKIESYVQQNGTLHSATGIDYFIFTKGVFTDILPFGIGRASWDCWLVYQARQANLPVIEGTGKILAIHQNHEYAVKALKGGGWNLEQQEVKKNFDLSKGLFRDISNATHIIRRNRVRRKNLYLLAEPLIFGLQGLKKSIKAYLMDNGKDNKVL